MDFKQRVLRDVISGAVVYKTTLLDFEYLLYSSEFTQRPYYILSANEDNYEHLTGVHSLLPARDFFTACYQGTLKESDFDFEKGNKSEKTIKGSVRQKILALPSLSTLFLGSLQAEEGFSKGNVHCFVAAADNSITLGFVNAKYAIPKSLLRGKHLDHAKAVDVSLVLRRNKGAEKFDTILQGGIAEFCSSFPGLFQSDHK